MFCMKMQGVGRKRKGISCLKASSFRNVNHKTTRKSSRVIVRDYSGQCSVQFLKNIESAMEQSDWLILVIDPVN